MLNKNILFIGANLITYEIISYLYANNLVGQSSIYIYDDSILYKRDYYRLSWWLKENYNDCASKVCVKYFTTCKSVSKDDLAQLGSSISFPDIVIFTSSHVMKEISFKKLVDRFIDNNIKMIMAMNHNLYGYYDNNINKDIDDIKCNIYSLNDYVRQQSKNNHDNFVKEYIKYIYSCSRSIEQDDMSDYFKYANMNSIFYQLSSILAMLVVRDLVYEYVDTSIMFDWSLLRNNGLYFKKTDDDDYKYIETANWMNNMRNVNILVDVNNDDIFNLLMRQLHYIGYFKYNNGKLYILCDKEYQYENSKIVYIKRSNNCVNDIMSSIHQVISISNKYENKKRIDDLCIRYMKPCIYINMYDNIPFVEIMNSIPNVTQTYKETNYCILDRSSINNDNISIDWRLNMSMSMIIVQWMIQLKLADTNNINYKKYMMTRIDKNIICNIGKKCKDYYNNTYDNDYKRVIYTIPDIFNMWTRINIYEKDDSIYKLSELLNYLQDEHGIVPYKVMYGDDELYNKEKYMEKKKLIDRLLKPWIYNRINDRHKVIAILNVYCNDKDGNELVCPPLYYHIGK
jgi:hypothetical protein